MYGIGIIRNVCKGTRPKCIIVANYRYFYVLITLLQHHYDVMVILKGVTYRLSDHGLLFLELLSLLETNKKFVICSVLSNV